MKRMSRIVASVCAAVMAGSLSITTAPAFAQAQGPFVRDHIVDVQYRGERRGPPRGEWRGDRRGFHYRNNQAWYGQHRGYRNQRPGYRYHDGWWFPPAAFALGAIIGGAIANQPPPGRPGGAYYGSPSHVRWCMDRYRSYRASDNTFQPYGGPRQQCRSPFG